MKITGEEVIVLEQELRGLQQEDVGLVSKYWLRKIYKELYIELQDLLSIYVVWEFKNKGKTYSEFVSVNKDFKTLSLSIKDYVINKSDFSKVQISKYPVFNKLFTNI